MEVTHFLKAITPRNLDVFGRINIHFGVNASLACLSQQAVTVTGREKEWVGFVAGSKYCMTWPWFVRTSPKRRVLESSSRFSIAYV